MSFFVFLLWIERTALAPFSSNSASAPPPPPPPNPPVAHQHSASHHHLYVTLMFLHRGATCSPACSGSVSSLPSCMIVCVCVAMLCQTIVSSGLSVPPPPLSGLRCREAGLCFVGGDFSWPSLTRPNPLVCMCVSMCVCFPWGIFCCHISACAQQLGVLVRTHNSFSLF